MTEPIDVNTSPSYWLQVQFEAERAVRDHLGPDVRMRWDGPTLLVMLPDGREAKAKVNGGTVALTVNGRRIKPPGPTRD